MSDPLNVQVKVPHWVKWIAVDRNGEVFGYRNEPVKSKHGQYWVVDEKQSSISCAPQDVFLYAGYRPHRWRQELYTWA
jgi:hypothetical protein